AQTLMEMNVLRSRVGLALLGAAVLDDVLVILLLSITSIVVGTGGGGFGTIVVTLLRMIGYLLVAAVTAYKFLPPFIRWIDRLNINQGVLAAVLITSLFYAWTAELVGGMAAITGSFIVGLFLAQTPYKHQIETGMSALAYGLFVPIFFVNIGLEVNLRDVSGAAIWFAVALLIVAVGSKVLGCSIGARLNNFSLRESIQVGIGMAARGEVGLIVAAFALGEGFLSAANFSIVVFMVISAALVTPPLLRASFAGERETAVS
ncbi:MAG: cation:proton antiporter, partial [Chloroflexi bacterium]|nr:cation:proton antiporter [Chloroflexota bacterium]